MDIDSPPSNSFDDLPLSAQQHPHHSHLNLPHFSASFPLPFRVFTLVGLELLLWAINLHVLSRADIDAGSALDIGEEDIYADDGRDLDGTGEHDDTGEAQGKRRLALEQALFDVKTEDDASSEKQQDAHHHIIRLNSRSPGSSHARTSLKSEAYRASASRRERRTDLHWPIYALFIAYTLWVGAGWLVFRYASNNGVGMDESRWVIVIIAIGIGVGLGWRRGNFIARAERTGFLRSIRRVFSPPRDYAPYFADVIVADILTSFAKVLGDLVTSVHQMYTGGLAQGRVKVRGLGGYITLAMVS